MYEIQPGKMIALDHIAVFDQTQLCVNMANGFTYKLKTKEELEDVLDAWNKWKECE